MTDKITLHTTIFIISRNNINTYYFRLRIEGETAAIPWPAVKTSRSEFDPSIERADGFSTLRLEQGATDANKTPLFVTNADQQLSALHVWIEEYKFSCNCALINLPP